MIRPALFAVPLLAILAGPALAATEDLGKGFAHHGVATPVSNHRGTVATADGQGRDVVLVLLFDHRGGYALLAIDAETGKSEQFPMPFNPGGDGPYASLLSTGNKFYFVKGIARLDPETYKIAQLAQSPVPIGPGGDYLDGRIYFGSGSHVYSYRVPE